MGKFEPTRKNAELEAQRLIDSEWADRGLPVDPTFIARSIGVKVFDMDLQQGISGMLKYFEGGKTPVVLVNSRDGESRKRFTVAHELGHFVLNTRRSPNGEHFVNDVYHRDENSSSGVHPEEVFANQFAAELLMPKKFVQLLVSARKADLVLAADFGVSVEAMNHRLANLKIKPETLTG